MKAKARPAKPKGKQQAGQRYKSSLLPMAVSGKKRSRRRGFKSIR